MNFDGTHSNFVVRDNALVEVGYGCKRDVTYTGNLVSGTPCSETEKPVSDLAAVPIAAAASYPVWPPPLPGERRAKGMFSIFPNAAGSRRCRVPRESLAGGHGSVAGTCSASVASGAHGPVVSFQATWQERGRPKATRTWRITETLSGRPVAVASTGDPLPKLRHR
jgi:hypothetical protein